MKRNVIVDNEEVLISEGFLDYLVVDKKTGEWQVFSTECKVDCWFDIIGSFSSKTCEKIMKSNMFSSYEEEEKELLSKLLKKEIDITYTAEAFMYGELVATTREYSTESELREDIDKIFNREDLTIEIYRTVSVEEQEGQVKQTHKFIDEI